MLPFYVSNRTYRSANITSLLLTRSRLTNLGVVLLSSATILSLLFNLYSHSPSAHSRFDALDDPTQTISRDPRTASLEHLIIVPGHAIWHGTDPNKKDLDSEWILEEYQKGNGRIQAFWDHIAAGAELAVEDDHSLLIFSGGQTRPSSISTEASSYLRLALASNLFSSSSSPIFPRVTTEDYALDSYQNLLFSIARFHEFTGSYPKYITIIGYEMKRKRFEELHGKAIRWPKDKLKYIGIDADDHNMETGKQGELTNAYLPFTKDVYGCHTSLLSKRVSRNPFLRFHPYWASAKELRGLMSWCPTESSSHDSSWWSSFFGSTGIRSSRDSDQEPAEPIGWNAVYQQVLPWDS